MSDFSLLEKDIRSIGAGYRQGSWSPVDVTSACLQRIEDTEVALHAWVHVDADGALQAAAAAEREIAQGTDRGPLHGIPIGVKDIFDVAGLPTRCGSRARDHVAPAESNAVVVEHLIRGGAVVLGKTVTQEFAAGVISAPARNPWDQSRIPGGSSGGSAAAVAVRAAFGALGSDTGGSIRIPAAACGVTGFKPTFGNLSLEGVYPLSWSLDTAGPIAGSVDDTWLLWKTLQAEGNVPALPLTADIPACRVRVGLPRQYFLASVQPSVREAFETALSQLAQAGVSVVDVDWPLARAAHACSFIINRVETASVHLQTAIEEPEAFRRYGADLRVRVAAGSLVPVSAYIQAQRLRTAIRDSMVQLFEIHHLDGLIAPTLPTAPVDAERLIIEETGLEESLGAAWTRLTMPFNATGQPVLCIPGGLDGNGLPVGLQLAGQPGEEEVLFQIGRAVEAAVGFPSSHLTRPIPASS